MAGNRKKVHTSWADGTEMVEEYDLAADVLLSATAFFCTLWPIGPLGLNLVAAARKVRSIKQTGGLGPWEFEVGEPERKDDNELVTESTSNPIFVRKDTPSQFQWRIRNLPYPMSGGHPMLRP